MEGTMASAIARDTVEAARRGNGEPVQAQEQTLTAAQDGVLAQIEGLHDLMTRLEQRLDPALAEWPATDAPHEAPLAVSAVVRSELSQAYGLDRLADRIRALHDRVTV